jgi:hypothetical protein
MRADLALLSVFEHTVSVIQYSPAVFDAFVNQTNVSPFVGLLQYTLRLECVCVLSFGGRVFGL